MRPRVVNYRKKLENQTTDWKDIVQQTVMIKLVLVILLWSILFICFCKVLEIS